MMLKILILILDIIEISPDNAIGPLVKELALIMQKMPVWERKEEWKRLQSDLKQRFHDKITTVDLLERIREHVLDLEDKVIRY